MSSIRARHAPPASAAGGVVAPLEGPAPGVIVVTLDEELENALRAACPAPMSVATTPAALADLLMNGRVGALVLDIGALDAAALTVARHLAEQFPEVPLVAVGYREDEARLAGLISRGLVYRFLHRPVSAARARNFIDAALRRSGEFDSGARLSPARAPSRMSARTAAHHRSVLALVAAGAVVALGLGFWLAIRPPAAPLAAGDPAAAGKVEPAPVATVASSAPLVVEASTPRAPTAAPAAVASAPAQTLPTRAPRQAQAQAQAQTAAAAANPPPAPESAVTANPDTTAPGDAAAATAATTVAASGTTEASSTADESRTGTAVPPPESPEPAPKDPPGADGPPTGG